MCEQTNSQLNPKVSSTGANEILQSSTKRRQARVNPNVDRGQIELRLEDLKNGKIPTADF